MANEPHTDFQLHSQEELVSTIREKEEQISFASRHGNKTADEREFLSWLITERRLAEEELARRRGYPRKKPQGGQSELWPELLTAKEVLSLPPDPTRWIWEDCLPVKNMSLLVAKPKVGKSTFAACLSVAVARGLPFLNRSVPAVAPVAYLSLDASIADMLDSFKRFKLKESDPIFFYAGRSPERGVDWLLKVISDYGVRFVVIDTMQRLFRFKKLEDYAEISNALEPALESNCHIMLLHHAGKDQRDDLDSAIGSTALRGLAYSYLHLKRLPDSTRRIFRTDQRGGRNFDEIAISDGSEGWIEKTGTRQEAEIEDVGPVIITLLKDEDRPMSEKEIRAAIPKHGIIVSKGIRLLLKKDDIERTGSGKRGDAFKYSVAGSIFPDAEEDKTLFLVK